MFSDMVRKSDAKTRFAVHCGDIIEGYTKNQETHEKVLRESFALMHEYFNKIPLYFVKGNHEAIGLGGKKAWENVGVPELSGISGKKLSKSCYTVRSGDDLFIFLDYSDPGYPEFAKNVLDSLTFKPRYVFAVIHWEVVPFYLECKKKLCDVLAPYNAIILHGHSHRTQHLRYEKNGGTITTFSIGSALLPEVKDILPAKIDRDLPFYIKSLERKVARYPEMQKILRQDSLPYVTYYTEYSTKNRWQGYARLHISDEGVFAELQSGDLSEKPLKIKLTR